MSDARPARSGILLVECAEMWCAGKAHREYAVGRGAKAGAANSSVLQDM
jgi:hypothetical protein